MCLNFGRMGASRFFRVVQFHRTQRTAMTRRMARSPANPAKMLLLWSLSLQGNGAAAALVLISAEEDASQRLGRGARRRKAGTGGLCGGSRSSLVDTEGTVPCACSLGARDLHVKLI